MILKLVNQYHKLRQCGDHQKQELSEWKQAEHKIRGINHKQLQEKKRQALWLWGSKSRRNSNWEKTHSSNSVSAIDRTPNCITIQHSSCKIIVRPLFHSAFRYCGCIANLTFIYSLHWFDRFTVFISQNTCFAVHVPFMIYFIWSLTNSSFATKKFTYIKNKKKVLVTIITDSNKSISKGSNLYFERNVENSIRSPDPQIVCMN